MIIPVRCLLLDRRNGAFAGTVRVRENITLDPAFQSYTGAATFDAFAPDGSIMFSGADTTQGMRITLPR